jgi:acetyl-CoA carboxylase biotin carboxyl carrier protein
MKMTYDDIKQILELVRDHELAEFELEQEGMKLRVRKTAGLPGTVQPAVGMVAPAVTAPANATPVPAIVAPPLAVAEEEALELAVVTSPIVGTFYRSASPETAPFVEVGATVRKGQVLCIIEAMKLMNEIESEYAGEIVKVYVDNGQPVQYGERLFAIRAG